MKKRLVLIFLLILAATGAVIALGSATSEHAEEDALYRTARVTRGSIAQIVTANGTLNPMQIANVGSQVSGKVTALHVKVNDEVKEGQLLAEIDPKLLASELKQSRASLESARIAFEQAGRDLERTKTLVAKDYVAKVELERAHQSYLSSRNSYESVKASVERDELNLSYAQITSPIDGVVIEQKITLGETVAASFQAPNLYRIAGSLTEMKIDVNLPEADIGKVKVDMPVTFTVDAFPEKEFSGKVSTVNLNPTTEQGVVTYSVTVSVLNPEKKLLPGMTAYVNITLTEKKDVLRVPPAALRFAPPREQGSAFRRLLGGDMRRRAAQRNDGQSIYVLADGEPKRVEVKTGAMDDNFIEVISEGLKEGDTVILGLKPVVE